MRTSIGALLALFIIVPVSAQEIRTVTFEGSVEQNFEMEPGQVGGFATISDIESIARFIAFITYDETNMLAAGYVNGLQFYNPFISVEYSFLDSEGVEIPQTFPTQLMDGPNGTLGSTWLAFDGPLVDQDIYVSETLSDTNFTNDNQESFMYWLDFQNNGNPLFEESADGYLRYVEYAGNANHSGYFTVFSDAGEDSLNFLIDTVAYGSVDADEDGISDSADSCTSSIMNETVSFGGWYETGVTNYLDESGCTIMDRYAACEAEAQPTAPTGPMFSTFSGPSYCETQVAYGLQSDGMIDYMESRMLRNALYNYYRSGGNVN